MQTLRQKHKILLQSLFRRLPIYKHSMHALKDTFNSQILNTIVESAIKNVPYYKNYATLWRGGEHFDELPIIRKEQMVGHEREFLSRWKPTCLLYRGETGGTTGISLTIYKSLISAIKGMTAADDAFAHIGTNLRIGMLRKQYPEKGVLWQDIGSNVCLLSAYQMTSDRLEEYLDILDKQKIECIHAYPSSLMVLVRLIANKYGTINLSHLKGILTSSEVFTREDKQLVKQVFGTSVKVVDYFSQSEAYCAGYSIDDGYYHFNNNFGYAEFVDTGRLINGHHHIAEIVATNIMVDTMTFIRVGTDDFVEIDDNGNIHSIIGRKADFLVDKNGELISCIAYIRNNAFKNVINFQYWQPEPGKLVFRIVGGGQFTDRDREYMLQDIQNTFVTLDCDVQVVDSIAKTPSGKQKRVVQDFDLSSVVKSTQTK